MADKLWLALVQGERVTKLLEAPDLPFTVGADPMRDLVVTAVGVEPHHGTFEDDGRKGMRWVPEGEGKPTTVRAGTHLRVGAATLAALRPPRGAGADPRPVLEKVLALVPRLGQAADDGEAIEAVLDTLLGVFGADWAAFLEFPDEPGPPEVVRSVGSRAGDAEAAVSRTALGLLAQNSEAVLTLDAGTSGELANIASLHQDIRSVIACRLGAEGEASGAVYLESQAAGKSFTEVQRSLLEVLCAYLGDLVAGAQRARRLATDNERLEGLRKASLRQDHAEPVRGESPAMRPVWEQVEQVAEAEVTALLLGESGTGKEVLTRSIHALSARRDRPFVAVNCMALARELVESELFGHVKGAFSGAHADRVGRFEMADGGTLFLDEVGELSLDVQVKLLRVLEEREIERLGEGRTRKVDVHLVAATNADLPRAVAEGRFREDLYYRLGVFVVNIPPLRERMEDLPGLVTRFVTQFRERYRKSITGVDEAALAVLRAHTWPGNIRELRNVLEQAVVRERGPRLSAASLSLLARAGDAGAPAAAPAAAVDPDRVLDLASLPAELDAAKATFEKQFLRAALVAEGGNVAATLRRLGVSRSTFYRRARELDLDPEAIRQEASKEG